MPDLLPPEVVRAYDIRGVVPEQLDEPAARRIGWGFGALLRQLGLPAAVVGRDARASSPALYDAAIDGLRRAGIDVHAAGMAPTPVIGWAAAGMPQTAALIVTASHNPPSYNGFKLLSEDATPLLPDDIAEVARLANRADETPADTASGAREGIDAVAPYLAMLAERFGCASGIRTAIDPGNGAAAVTAPHALLDAGARLHAIRSTPRPLADTDIAADPQDPESMRPLARTTRAANAELGIAWDGDGDRIGVVDHLGRRYEADWLTALLARPMLARRPGAEVLLDMKAGASALDDIRSRGGVPALARTGYSFFRRTMRERGIAFGGETSGHIMFGPDYRPDEHAPWLDDGVYAACALLAWLAERGRSLAEEMAEIVPRPISPELRLPCPDTDKASAADAVGDWFADRHPNAAIDRSDGARVSLDDGWLHARASNTAPALSLRFEADDEAAYRRLAEQLHEALSQQPSVSNIDQLQAPPTIGPQPLV